MSAFGWITSGQRLLVASFLRRRNHRKSRPRVSVPGVESLETIDLLSSMAHGLAAKAIAAKAAANIAKAVAASAQVEPFASQTITMNAMPAATTQTTALQTVTVPDTLTNFTKNFAPPINLFNPVLGTLVAVKVTPQASLSSDITSENTSTTSGADITGFTNGSFTITGLNQTFTGNLSGSTDTVSVPAFAGGTPNFTGPSTVVFPTLTVPSNIAPVTYTAPSDLAFFTASAGRTTVTPTLTESAESGANAPNGNLETLVQTSGAGTVTVTYEYMATCPPVTKLVRYGIHHQPTTIVLTFGGPLDPAQASNPAFYTIVAPNANGSFTGKGTKTIPVSSAVYNPANDTVTLTTSKQLNVHLLFQLEINLPCSNGNPTVIEFGSKMSLGGFTNPHNGAFIPVINGVPQGPNGPIPYPK